MEKEKGFLFPLEGCIERKFVICNCWNHLCRFLSKNNFNLYPGGEGKRFGGGEAKGCTDPKPKFWICDFA